MAHLLMFGLVGMVFVMPSKLCGCGDDLCCGSCILGELFIKKPLFQANQELAQLEMIR